MIGETALAERRETAARQVAPGVTYLTIVFVNLYFIGEPGGAWALVDTGLPLNAARVRAAAEARFGADARPTCIILTHGHFDHSGNALELADAWRVPVYAHELELPYLIGRSAYPPADPTVGGALAQMSRVFPSAAPNLGNRVRPFPAGGVPGLPDWRIVHTPGHTAGHVSLFRESDRTLIAGDALATVNQESLVTLATLKRELRTPPAPLTTDWRAARESVERLAELQPAALAAGHGLPLTRGDVAGELRRFAINFEPPADGRYVRLPALADESGVISVPPPVADPVGNFIKVAALALAAGLAFSLLTRRRR